MKKVIILLITLGVILMYGCSKGENDSLKTNSIKCFTKESEISDVINNESFTGFGNLIFPVDLDFDKNMKLEDVGDIYIWYNYINPDKTVEIVNFLKEEADKGEQVFYNIYTEEEMRKDKEKEIQDYSSLEEKKIQKWRFLMMEEDLCMLEQCKIVFLML